MDKNRKKILFVSHDSSLTGAPVLLLNLLKLLVSTNSFDINVLLYRGGILEDDFKKVAPVTVFKKAGYFKRGFFFLKIIDYLDYRIRKYSFRAIAKKSDLIMNNTIVNGSLVKEFSSFKIPVLTYVHELESVIKEFNKKGECDLTMQFSRILIAPSEVVADNLINNHRIPPQKIARLNYFFIPPELYDAVSEPERGEDFFKKYGIPKGKFYVAGMGAASYRKGFDIFIETCKEASRLDKNIRFTWIGDYEDDETRKTMQKRIEEYGIADYFRLTGRIPHSPLTLRPFDVFALTSREDPYPLVVIEAAYMKVPALCFEGSGGAAEFISGGCGWLVPGFSPVNMAMKIAELVKDPMQVREKGAKSREKAIQRHSNEEHILDQFKIIIDKGIAKK